MFASLSRRWHSGSAEISLQHTQTTAIGYVGAIDTDSVQTKFSYAPGRKLIAYLAPAVMRSTHNDLQGTVYRIAFGARYAVTRLVGIDVNYNLDKQNGAIDPLRATAQFSHSILSVGFTTQWSSDGHGAQQWR